MHLEFVSDTHTYRDSAENVYTFTGCTLPNLIKFNARYKELHELWPFFKEFPIQIAYLSDARFRLLCDECLRLNGIDPSKVSALSLHQLLISHTDFEGNYCDYGALIPINKIEKRGKDTGEPLTMSTAIAMMSHVTGGNALDAVALMDRLSADDTIGLVHAVIESSKMGEEIQADRVEDWKSKIKDRFQVV